MTYSFDLTESALGVTINLQGLFGREIQGYIVLAGNIFDAPSGLVSGIATWPEGEVIRAFDYHLDNYGNPSGPPAYFLASNPEIGLPDRYGAAPNWTMLGNAGPGVWQYLRLFGLGKPSVAMAEGVFGENLQEAGLVAADAQAAARESMAGTVAFQMAQTLSGPVELVRYSVGQAAPDMILRMTLPEDSTLTNGDLVVYDPGSPFSAEAADARLVFSIDDTVHIRAGDLADDLRSEGFRAGHLVIDAGGGDDGIYIQRNAALGLDADLPAQLTIRAGDGDDVMQVDAQRLVVIAGGQGNDQVMIGYSALPSSARSRLLGGAGNDTLDGSAGGRNTQRGGAGDDVMTGGNRADLLLGQGGRDSILGGAGADRILAGAGDDHVASGTGNDRLEGGTGNDSLYAEAGRNLLLGGTGDDTLAGGAGRDTLIGGAGDDLLAGADGADLFVFAAGMGEDSIENAATQDRLLLDRALWSGTANALAAAAEVIVISHPFTGEPIEIGLRLNLQDGAVLDLMGLRSADRAALAEMIRFGSHDEPL